MSEQQEGQSAEAADPAAQEDWHAGHAACGPSAGKTLEAEGEVAVSRLLMHGGDLAHAAKHVGFAIGTDPLLPEAHEALAELAARVGGPAAALDLFPMERPYIGAVAARANLAAAAGRHGEAVGLLASAIAHQPESRWAQVAWLQDPELPAKLSSETLAEPIGRVNTSIGNPPAPAVVEALGPFYAMVRACVAQHPSDAWLLAMASGLARRLGDPGDAVAWARRAYEIQPEHLFAAMLGLAVRDAGDPNAAAEIWEAELRRDTGDLSMAVDLAELYSALGRHDEALRWIDRILAAEPAHPLANPALHGVRFAQDADLRHLVALADLAREHPEWEYAARLLAQRSEGRSWLNRAALASEATTNAVRKFAGDESISRDSVIRFQLSALEVPSSILTLRMLCPQVEATFATIGLPDMREPSRPVQTRVWRYQGMDAVPAVAPPSASTVELVRNTVTVTWPSLPAAFDQAIGLSALDADQLLAVLVHPPTPTDPRGSQVFEQVPDLWVRSVQAFACLGIAYLRGDEPWLDSQRRSILTDLLFGPEDWVTEAAAFGLLATAWADPATREDVGRLLTERLLEAIHAGQTREVTILESLCKLALACPGLDPRIGELARTAVVRIGGSLEGAPPPGQPGPREQPKRRKLFGRR